MFNVNNKKCIRNLAIKSFIANKTRNIIAVVAIVLTTVLFTSVFTVGLVLKQSFQLSNFRQVGGYAHGSIGNVTYEDIEILKNHSDIKEYGVRRDIGSIYSGDFKKNNVEVKYFDEVNSKLSYINLIEGNLPKDDSMEIVTDLEVLKILNVEPIIGSNVTITYNLYGDVEVTETFLLSGYYESDFVGIPSFVFLPKNYVDKIYEDNSEGSMYSSSFGEINLDILLHSDKNIADTIIGIINDSGFQNTNSEEDNYLDLGVNWGYLTAQANASFDSATIVSLFGLLTLFIITGYLIIFNIFKISISRDIRYYGLLKTIGTSGKQIYKIIYTQATLLSVIGIPIGLACGLLVGNFATLLIIKNTNTSLIDSTFNPFILVGGSIFSIFTIFLSCYKPAKIASRVSPIEAVKYVESNKINKKFKKSYRLTPFNMAKSNMLRNTGKIVTTIISLALPILIFQFTMVVTTGFSLDKYVSKMIYSDFLVGHVDYLNFRSTFDDNKAVPEELISLQSMDGIINSGMVYKSTEIIIIDKDTDTAINVFILDDYVLEKFDLIDGTTEDGLIALYRYDDYDKPDLSTNSKSIGETVNLQFVTNWVYDDSIDDLVFTDYEEENFKVVGGGILHNKLGDRKYFVGVESFILPYSLLEKYSEYFKPMNIIFEVDEESNEKINEILLSYTSEKYNDYDVESKELFAAEFNEFKSTFFTIGALLSVIIGFIGLLNFFNTILTSINVRKKEFAILQSIGMTGKQLNLMLIYESIFYVTLSLVVSVSISLLLSPIAINIFESVFWFFDGKFSFSNIILVSPWLFILGIFLPLAIYKGYINQSVVERLREI